VLLISLGGDESEHFDFKLLADSMGTSDCLKIILWVPVGVIDHYHSCLGQINSQTSSPGCEKENTELIILIKSLNTDCSILALDGTCQNLVPNFLVHEIVLDDFRHAPKLRKDKHLMAIASILLYELV
jgi:hypothetical protein